MEKRGDRRDDRQRDDKPQAKRQPNCNFPHNPKN